MPRDRLSETRKLIALASSPNREEARNAAYKACELIRKHGFEIVDPKRQAAPLDDNEFYNPPPPQGQRPPKPPVHGSGFGSWVDDFIDDLFSSGGERIDVHVYPARHAGQCAECGGAYSKGERVATFPGKGTLHVRCSKQRR